MGKLPEQSADTLGGRFRSDQFGKVLFQFLEFSEKLVVFAVGDELPAFDVIGVIVPVDLIGEFGVAGFGLGESHETRITRISTN